MTAVDGASGLRASGATDVGRRRQANEDRFHVDPARGIFIVVDGLGGHAAGDKAADTAIAAMTERLTRQTGPPTDRMREAITIANNEIHRLAASRADWAGMACVATAAVVEGDRAIVGHVGDSRLYRLLDGQIEKITPDHSPVGEREDADELSELEAMRHPRRNEVYRDVGSEPRDVADAHFVFVAEISLPPGAALLLCSDGLTDLVPSDTIRRTVAAHGGSPERVVQALIAAANDAGGRDNITVVYVERPAATGGGQAWESRRPAGRVPVPLLVTLAAAGGVILGLLLAGHDWGLPRAALRAAGAVPLGTPIVQPGESIMQALAAAAPGTSVIVEPGDYAERITLRDGVRLVSRVPRGATIRLPPGSADSDAAVSATGIRQAEIDGFRIIGDAGSPLGVGVIARNASVRLVDLEIAGAVTSAVDLGAGGDVVLSGSHIRDNPGSGLVIRAGAAPRVTHNVFARNATADELAPAIVHETGAVPDYAQNVFMEMTVNGIAGLEPALRERLLRANVLVAPPSRPGAAAARQGRGQ